MTFGELRARLSALPYGAGVDVDVLNGYINDRARSIFNRHTWTRKTVMGTIAVIAEYVVGTVTIANGSTGGSGTGTTFTSAMNGRRIRVSGRPEFYEFTFVTATQFTIDRPYESPDAMAVGYRIWQPIYALPIDTDYVESIKVPDVPLGGDLNQISREELDRISAGRTSHDTPAVYTVFDDDDAGNPQIELYPGPKLAMGLPVRRHLRFVEFTESDTGVELPVWLPVGPLLAGVEADLLELAGDPANSDRKERKFETELRHEQRRDYLRMAPTQLPMADRFVKHRAERIYNSSLYKEEKRNRLR